jgi:hypothetical protein
LFPLHDSTILALQGEYTAINADNNLATVLPGFERVDREEWLTYQPVVGLSNGRYLNGTAPVSNSATSRSKIPPTELRAEFSWPFRIYGDSRNYIQSPDERSRLPDGQFPSDPSLKDDLQVMAPSAVSTDHGSADTAAGTLVYTQQLGRYHAGALTTHLNSFGVSVTSFGSGWRSLSGDLGQSKANLASYEQRQCAEALRAVGARTSSCDNRYESQSQHQRQLYSGALNQIAPRTERKYDTLSCATVNPSGFAKAQQAASQRFALQSPLIASPGGELNMLMRLKLDSRESSPCASACSGAVSLLSRSSVRQ